MTGIEAGRRCPFGPDRLPKLIATDLDGTIFHSREGFISERVRRALFAAEDLGVPVAIVTGRPIRWLPPVIEASELDGRHLYGAAVLCNGAVVVELPDFDEVVARRFQPLPAMEVLQASIPDLHFAVESGGLDFYFMEGYPRPVLHPHDHPVSWDQLAHTDGVKLLARHVGGMAADELLATASEVLEGVATPTISGLGTMLEVSALGVNKGSGLMTYCAMHNIDPSEVIAFGDMPNDRDMMAVAGWSVAVGDAHPLLLETTDEQAPSLDDDGVAVVLERILGS